MLVPHLTMPIEQRRRLQVVIVMKMRAQGTGRRRIGAESCRQAKITHRIRSMEAH